tara:strand:- start:83 stop:304 length:222 start_codon:yes stop_codon:yes gene_type:complete
MSATAFQRMRREAAAKPAQIEAPEELTRESIAKMKRADVVEHLEAHGLTEDDCEGIKVGELRDMLTNAVFTGI